MTVDRVISGEEIEFRASKENEIRDAINRLMNLLGEGGGDYGSAGVNLLSSFAAPHAIFELQNKVWIPGEGGAPTPIGLSSAPDVAYSVEAQRIWLNHSANTYGQASLSPEVTIYYPMAYDGVVGLTTGSRTAAWYDEQSGRWWSNDAGLTVFGKLDGALSKEGSATLNVWGGAPLADLSQTVTVWDWFLKTGATLATSTKCKGVWYQGRRYVDTAECPT